MSGSSSQILFENVPLLIAACASLPDSITDWDAFSQRVGNCFSISWERIRLLTMLRAQLNIRVTRTVAQLQAGGERKQRSEKKKKEFSEARKANREERRQKRE
jgi:hypothetical protein